MIQGLSLEELLKRGAKPIAKIQQEIGLSKEQLINKGAVSVSDEQQDLKPGEKPSFFERLKLSFTDPSKIKELEQKAGVRGKLDTGDIADVAGGAPSFVGGILGGLGGTITGTPIGGIAGTAIGIGAGEIVRQSIGGIIKSFTEDLSPEEQKQIVVNNLLVKPAIKGTTAYIFGKTGQYVLSRLPKLLGIATGETVDTIQIALSDPKTADLGLKNGDVALRKAIETGSQQSISLRDKFIKGFQAAFKELINKEGGEKLVNRNDLWNEFYKIIENKGVKIITDPKNPGLDFTTSIIKAHPGEIGKINAVYEALKQWDDFSLQGVVKLKQLVGALTKFADEAGIPSKSAVLGNYYHSVDNLIKQNLSKSGRKAFEGMNKIYSNNIDLFDDMVSAFNSRDPFSTLANSLGKNKDSLRQVLQFYESLSGQKILPVVAGREIATEKTSGGLLGTGLGFRNFVDFFWSPSSQARFVIGTGRITKPASAGLKTIYGKAQEWANKNLLPLK